MFIRQSIITLALAIPFASAFAMDSAVEKSIALKDGSVVHQFKNGQMAMEDRYGRPMRMNAGETMTAADGSSITMMGDEVAQLTAVLRNHYARGAEK